jgi:hypothetical protein
MGNSNFRVAQSADRESNRISTPKYSRPMVARSAQDQLTLTENVFHSMLALERRRAERSRKPFVLMLLDAHLENGSAAGILRNAHDVVVASSRETDLAGWYKENAILGLIFTEICLDGDRPVTDILRAKIEMALTKHMGRERTGKIAISLHVFPETWNGDLPRCQADTKVYPNVNRTVARKRLPQVIKRAIEIAGSVLRLEFVPLSK